LTCASTEDGKLLPPNLATMDVNLKGIYYSEATALWEGYSAR
jgi:hypothetical protein